MVSEFALKADHVSAERYARPIRRRQTLVSRALLRAVLRQMPGWRTDVWSLAEDAEGRPLARPASREVGAAISLSHSRDLVACAVADIGRIGIDIEYMNPDRNFQDLASLAFGPRERQTVEAEGASAFYRVWTLREAFAKASGGAFQTLIDGRDYFPTHRAVGRWQVRIDGSPWIFVHRLLPGSYAMSMAIDKGRLLLDAEELEGKTCSSPILPITDELAGVKSDHAIR